MERGKNNFTNTTITVTNYSNMNFMENEKMCDSTCTEFFENEEKSLFQKISETPNFYHKSLTSSVHLSDIHRKKNFGEQTNLRKLNKFNENTLTIKETSLNVTRNGKILKNNSFAESTEIFSNKLNSNPFSRSATDFINKDDLKNSGNVNLEKVRKIVINSENFEFSLKNQR